MPACRAKSALMSLSEPRMSERGFVITNTNSIFFISAVVLDSNATLCRAKVRMSVESESRTGPGSKKSSVTLQLPESVIYFVFTGLGEFL